MTALSASKVRRFLADVPSIDMVLPLKATTQVYEGSLLMWSSGAVTPVSGAGRFAGVCLETALGGASDGTVAVKVRVMGAIEVAVNTDTPAITAVGVAATVPEATDDDTIRIETGSSISGTPLGTFLRVVEPGTAGGKVVIHIKGAQVS